jgi:hypothetical protein
VGLGLAVLLEVSMEREQASAGLLIVFGKLGEEQTLGRIVRLSRARAKVESLERRKGREAGTLWNVPYELMEPADHEQAPAD